VVESGGLSANDSYSGEQWWLEMVGVVVDDVQSCGWWWSRLYLVKVKLMINC